MKNLQTRPSATADCGYSRMKTLADFAAAMNELRDTWNRFQEGAKRMSEQNLSSAGRKVQVGDVWAPNGADCVAEWVKETTITKLHMGQSMPYADAQEADGETWAMSLTRDGYPESAEWTLVRPAPSAPPVDPAIDRLATMLDDEWVKRYGSTAHVATIGFSAAVTADGYKLGTFNVHTGQRFSELLGLAKGALGECRRLGSKEAAPGYFGLATFGLGGRAAAEAPQVKVGQRWRAKDDRSVTLTVKRPSLNAKGVVCDLVGSTGRYEDTHVAFAILEKYWEPVEGERPKPAVGQVWRAVDGEPWCPEAKGQEVEVLSIDDDSAIVRWRYDSAKCCYRLRVFSPAVAHFDFVSHGTAPIIPTHEPEGIPGYRREVVSSRSGNILVPRNQPAPRCGQRWRGPRTGLIGTIYDHRTEGYGDHAIEVFKVRLEDGEKGEVAGEYFECCEFLGGPTQPETPREAFERVVRLEAADVPEGLSAGEWLGRVINACAKNGGSGGDDHSRSVAPAMVRAIASGLRVEHAARWQAWRGDASRGVR